MRTNTQNGNALFFILIAVVMLGLLTMMLSRGGSSTEQTGSYERASVEASQILRYAKSFEAAIQQIKLRDISENEISFENGATTTDYTNTNCDEDTDRNFPNCLIFDQEGAGLTYRNFTGANGGDDWIFTGANNVGTTDRPIGSTAEISGNDIVMLLPNVSDTLCIQINRQLDVGTTGTLPVDTTGIDITEFTGTFASGGPTILDGDPTPFELNGESAGCFIDDDSSTTYFYQVILAR